MNSQTLEVYNAIKTVIAEGHTRFGPGIFSISFPRAAVSAAFRKAKEDGIIEVAYYWTNNRPTYQPAGTKKATEEAKLATIQ